MSKGGTERGTGNAVSAEFNLVYRWHSATSKRDEQWTEEMYKEIFGKTAATVSLEELLKGLSAWEHNLSKDPSERPFAHLQRGADGKYSDDDLVKIMTDSIEDTAGMSDVPIVLCPQCMDKSTGWSPTCTRRSHVGRPCSAASSR